ncbi:polysaccharide pyruvyl transferase family protein [Thermomonospora amylolytica]|uniref:polysaccharide pyruvyl transferase family protein n=1 Tax=Thermomonospora amylolytica TaxID=1411117 RepID=UPI000E6BE5ED|nr:polysaccharide pyruvyl transferase family protein [Thermomonospora amylolytica]
MTAPTLHDRSPTIGLLGSYGGLNLGDEAILECVLSCLRHHRPAGRPVVFSRNPEHTRAHHRVAATVAWQRVGREHVRGSIRRLDGLVLGGGGIIYDGEAGGYLRLVRDAQEHGIPTFAYAVGAGPLRDAEDRRIVREVMNDLTDLTVRDEESKLVLEDAGVTRTITVTADPAMLMEPEPFTREMLRDEGVPPDARLIGMSVREPGRAAEHLDVDSYHALLGEVGDFLVRRLDAHLLFVPMEADDVRHSHAVLSHMTAARHGRILHGQYRPAQILGLARHLDLAVGMRLHFLIFMALAGVPFLPLPYAGKVFDFAQVVGAPALTGVARSEAGPLLAEVDRLWDEHADRMPVLRERVAALRERARMTCERFGDFIDKIG